ncbi:MAG: MotA/TolQ/ExbB proton channel family protein [Planctomycetes bacterium]|nr:MotA/TolQ/ExbB proton channel family protein [Planctomycetota bacterium]
MTMPMRVWTVTLAAGVGALVVAPALAGEAAGTIEPARRISLWTMIEAGGMIGHLILVLSLASTALVIEHFLSIRRSRLVPPELAQRVEQFLAARQYQQAQEACATDGSFLAKVIGAGLNQIGAMFGFFDMQSAMQEASEREISRLYRKLEYLSLIAVIAPLLGLLGTVTGMISSFNTIAATEGAAKPSQLAEGIWEALVTTVEGLVVAIPAMFFVAFFRNRVDSFVAETEAAVEKLMGRFRKGAA